MSWLALIRALLEIAVWFLNRASDEEQRKIGEDRAVNKALSELAVRTGKAKEIALASRDWTRDDIDRRLRDYYRD